jgi:hypothetical protein
VIQSGEEILKPEQRADPFVQRIFVEDQRVSRPGRTRESAPAF